jgi:hypothetical protein
MSDESALKGPVMTLKTTLTTLFLVTFLGLPSHTSWSLDNPHNSDVVLSDAERGESLDWYRLDHCVPAPVVAVPTEKLEPIPDLSLAQPPTEEAAMAKNYSLSGWVASWLVQIPRFLVYGIDRYGVSEKDPAESSSGSAGPRPTLAPPPDEVISLVLKENNVLCVPVEVDAKAD